MSEPSEDDFIFPEGISEEDKKRFVQHIKDHQASHMVARHRISNFFTTLSEENAQILREIFATMDGPEASNAANYYRGVCTSILTMRYGYCLACGEKHEAQLLDMLAQFEAGESEKSAGPHAHVETPKKAWPDVVNSLEPETLANLAKYRVNLVTNEYPKVACANCGMPYPSLEDRMIKDPDDCSGCHQKEAFG